MKLILLLCTILLSVLVSHTADAQKCIIALNKCSVSKAHKDLTAAKAQKVTELAAAKKKTADAKKVQSDADTAQKAKPSDPLLVKALSDATAEVVKALAVESTAKAAVDAKQGLIDALTAASVTKSLSDAKTAGEPWTIHGLWCPVDLATYPKSTEEFKASLFSKVQKDELNAKWKNCFGGQHSALWAEEWKKHGVTNFGRTVVEYAHDALAALPLGAVHCDTLISGTPTTDAVLEVKTGDCKAYVTWDNGTKKFT